jgi:N-methylhydantoinase A/oxoprolinase/acetone carboxylase beta subunit
VKKIAAKRNYINLRQMNQAEDGDDLTEVEAMKKIADIIATGPDGSMIAQELLQSLGYDVKIVNDSDGTTADFYSDDPSIQNSISNFLEEIGEVPEMSRAKEITYRMREAQACKTTWKYYSLIWFTP